MKRIIRTAATERAEREIRQAFRLIGDARADLTIWEFEEFIRSNLADLGGRGYVASIGQAILHATSGTGTQTDNSGTETGLSAKSEDT